MADYAAGKGVGLFVWRHWEKLNDPAEDYFQLRSFMDSVADCGVKGLKIDFMNGEATPSDTLYDGRARKCRPPPSADQFPRMSEALGRDPHLSQRTHPRRGPGHGTQPDHGQLPRTHAGRGNTVADRPHVPGDENQNIPASHSTALPFTRCVAGPADYTPAGFSMPGDVLPVQQLACAYLITSPLMTLAENPFYLFREERLRPALEFCANSPSAGTKTVVLPQSRIGSLAAFARRCGKPRGIWPSQPQKPFRRHSSWIFSPKGLIRWSCSKRTAKRDSAALERPVAAGESVPLDLPRNGGAVARFIRR